MVPVLLQDNGGSVRSLDVCSTLLDGNSSAMFGTTVLVVFQ